jgi:hypothetical protein
MESPGVAGVLADAEAASRRRVDAPSTRGNLVYVGSDTDRRRPAAAFII